MRIRQLLCYIIIIVSHHCTGYFCSGFVLKRKQKDNQEQCIVLLGDFHQKAPAIFQQQNQGLNLLLQECLYRNGKLIVEDLSSKNNEGRITCLSFLMKNEESLLGQLADKARAMNIDVDNVEYRYCRLLSLAPLLNDLRADPYSVASAKHITMFALYSEILNQINKIRMYNDRLFNSLYDSTIRTVYQELDSLSLQQYNNKKEFSVADYCAMFWNKKSYRNVLENLCIFDSPLLDMSILHAIAVSPNKRFIVIVAGASHIDNIKNIMLNLGYKMEYSSPQSSNFQPMDLEKIITLTK